jgi:AcrR family transcriptional regulator
MLDEAAPKGAQTRSGIIAAAHELFVRQGYHGTSMRQIAAQAGIALGGIYNHFPAKEDIFREVLLAYHPYHDVLPVLMAAQGETVEAVVRDAASGMIQALRSRPEFLNLMFIEIVEFKSAHMQELMAKIFPELLPVLQRIILVDGRVRPIPLPVLVRTFLGLFFSFYMTELILVSPQSPAFSQNAFEYMLDIFLHGILQTSSAG